jgi:hypothetical protein
MKKINQKFSFCILKTFTEKILVTFLLFSSPQLMLAQVSENFSDGDFIANPTWIGNDSAFSVTEGTLQLKAPPLTGTKYLATASPAINQAQWAYEVHMAFNPSSSNFARIYLTADQADLSQPLNGYFVMIGGTSDEVCLFKQTGNITTKIVDGADGVLNTSTVNITIKVTRDENGNWALFYDLNMTGNFTEVGRILDSDHVSSSFTGVYCRYTATRSEGFFFDNIQITGDPYIPPPSIAYKDLIITEILADPSPANDLPEIEFIEIYNRSTKALQLVDVVLTDGTTSAPLPAEKINPEEYVILCPLSHGEYFTRFGRTLGLSNFPSINNTGETLSLLTKGKLIDRVAFSSDSYHERQKAEGGWTLELIDIKNTCGEEGNWSAAETPAGGTPGALNSIAADKPDVTPPFLMACIPNDTALVLSFNERLDTLLPPLSSFTIDNGVLISGVNFQNDRQRAVVLDLSIELLPHVTYNLTMAGIRDCNNNTIDNVVIAFALPEKPDSMDVVINEVLFNPRPTGVDFVELRNTSDKFINLRDWSLARNEDDQLVKYTIVNEDYLLRPNAHLLLTTDANIVRSEYLNAVKDNFLDMTNIPQMNDDEGNIAIIDNYGKLIDEFTYTADMHTPFVKDKEGVSLERIVAKSPTQNPENWKSASETVGFATPGYQNSMAVPGEGNDLTIKVEPEIFKPVNGTPDFTQIYYNFNQGGLIGNVKIFDSYGRTVRAVANNALLGTSGFFRWDGDRDDGSKARVGNYMIWFEVFNSTGDVTTYRKRVAIAF